ncbi:MAG: glycosyltransferase [Patescibacteria group bacterium]
MNSENLKVLMISSDRNILAQQSPVLERMKEYGKLVKELHIVLLSDSNHNLKETQISDNVRVYPTSSSFKFFRPRDAAKLGKKIVLEKKFVRGESLITAQDPFECGWAGLKIKRKWRIPLEIQLHTDPFSPYFSGFLNRIRKRMARKTLRNADSIRVVSESLLRQLKIENSKLKIYTLPIYVEREKIENAPVLFDLHARFSWRFVILAVSRLTEEKNLPLALEVLSLIRQKFPDTGLVMVGSGPEEKSLRLKVKSLKLERNVAFEGWQESLASYYKTANVFIQTSRFEGYGLSLVEAGLSGLPVVTSPVGLALEFENGKEAYICPPDNAEYFASAILDLLENNQKRENLSVNMKNFLGTHLVSKDEYLAQMKNNWEKTASQIS